MSSVTADRVVVELSVKLDRYQADVQAAKAGFTDAMKATEMSAASAERVINSAANKIAADTANIGSAAKRTAAITEQANAAMGESATATAAVIARATELQTAEFAKQAAASAKAAAAIQESSAAIKSGLLAGAAPIAALFAGAEVVKLTDEYIKFTNSLRATGLEGAALTSVQERLFAVAQKYGAPLESLGALYSRAAIAGKELGLSQDQLIKLSEGVAASFKVAGTGAAQQKGALTQLSEAIGEPIVRARQFNSLLNDAPPIIQAVARGLDAAGGSVGKLGALIRAGGVTNTAFFAAFLKGSQSTIAQADKFQLTFSAAFTVLGNSLSKYIGETNDGLGASNRFALGIQGIANNLDTIIPALGVIAVAYGTMKVASGIAGSAAVKAARDVAVATTEQTAALVDGRTAAAVAARAEADGARAALADNQLYIASQREKIATMQLNGAASVELAAETKLLSTAERDLIVANAEAVVAIEAETAAVTEAGIAARLAAAGSALFSGALALLGGPVIAPIVIVFGALVAAIINVRNESEAAEKQTRDFAATIEQGRNKLDSARDAALQAAGAFLKVGADAASSTAHIGAFAGAVGNAADQLHRLALENRNKVLTEQTNDVVASAKVVTALEAKKAQAKTESDYAKASGHTVGTTEFTAEDAEQLKKATALRRDQQKVLDKTQAAPLESYVTESDKGRTEDGVKKEIVKLESDLLAATAARNTSAIASIKEGIELDKLYLKYRKQKLSPAEAEAAASKDAANFAKTAQNKVDDKSAKVAKADEKKGVRDNAAEQRKDASAEAKQASEQKSYDDALYTVNRQIIAASQSRANSIDDRAKVEIEVVEAERQKARKDIADEGPSGTKRFTADRVAKLQAEQDALAAQRIINVNLKAEAERQGVAYRAADTSLRNQEAAVSLQAQLALTAKDRRVAELKLLDLQLEEVRLRTAAILKLGSGATPEEREQAKRDLAAAEAAQPAKREQVRRSTAGPGEAYRDEVNKTGGQINEAIQGVAVNGLRALDDGLVNAITHFKSLGDVAKNVLDTIVSGLIRVAIQKAIIGPLSNFLFGGGSDPVSGGIGSLVSRNSASLPGRASGGDVVAGQTYRVNEINQEFFTPSTSGTISPNNGNAASGGGGNVTVIQPHNYDLRGAVMTADILAHINAASSDAAVRGAAGGAAMAGQNASRAQRRALG